MICVQSLWTHTTQWRINRAALLLHTLTLCHVRRHFDFVELVTDEPGLIIADRLRWDYDSYRVDLEHIDTSLWHIWAAGKLIAQRIQSKPYAHVDNDFILIEPLPREFRKAGVFAQGKDEPSYYLNWKHLPIFDVAGLPRGAVAYNAGVIGGNDLKTLHGYCEFSLELMHRVKHLPNGTVLSIITEQAGFGHYCREQGVRVEELIPLPVSAVEEDFHACKFTHLWAWTKKEPEWQERVEKRMMNEFPAEYARFNVGYPLLAEVLTHPRRQHVAYSYGIAKSPPAL